MKNPLFLIFYLEEVHSGCDSILEGEEDFLNIQWFEKKIFQAGNNKIFNLKELILPTQ